VSHLRQFSASQYTVVRFHNLLFSLRSFCSVFTAWQLRMQGGMTCTDNLY